jgi:phosphate transport system substrate-binding protein
VHRHTHFTMRKNVFLICFICSSFFFLACQNKPVAPSTPSFGVGIDETLRPFMQEELYMFQQQNPKVKVNALYGSEHDLFEAFNKDSLFVFVLAREFNQKEMDYFALRKIQPRYTPFGRDAIAFLVHPSNTDTLIKYAQLLEVLSGKITQWSQLNARNKSGAIQVVYDNSNSSTANFVTTLTQLSALPKNSFTAKAYQGVVDYVTNNKNAIGVVSSTYFSNLTNTERANFEKNTNILSVSPISPTLPLTYYKPDQANIADSLYPICRQLTYIDCTGELGWGLNLASFLRYDTGQRIALKAGVMPMHVPSREVNVTIKK